MDTKKFSIGDIINESWAIIKKNVWIFAATILGFLLIYFLISFLIGGGIGAASTMVDPSNPSAILSSLFSIGSIISMLVMTAISAVYYLGLYRMALDAADGRTPELSAFGAVSFRKILNLFIANILYSLAVYIGIILCIVPGILFAVRLQFYVFFIIEQDCNAIEALSKSWECSKGESLNLILLGLAFILINLLGALVCGIGLLVTMPMTIIAFALLYRIFTGSPADEVEFESITDEETPLV